MRYGKEALLCFQASGDRRGRISGWFLTSRTRNLFVLSTRDLEQNWREYPAVKCRLGSYIQCVPLDQCRKECNSGRSLTEWSSCHDAWEEEKWNSHSLLSPLSKLETQRIASQTSEEKPCDAKNHGVTQGESWCQGKECSKIGSPGQLGIRLYRQAINGVHCVVRTYPYHHTGRPVSIPLVASILPHVYLQ